METNPTRSKFVEFLRSQGFYVALALCLLIVGQRAAQHTGAAAG